MKVTLSFAEHTDTPADTGVHEMHGVLSEYLDLLLSERHGICDVLNS